MSPKAKNQYPAGWDEARVKEVLEHYENQTDEEAVAEDEAAMAQGAIMVVPPELVIEVSALIAKFEEERGKDKPRS